MKAHKIEVSQNELNELFTYKDGKLFNKTYRRGSTGAGKQVGGIQTTGRTGQYKRKYQRLTINGKTYRANRIIWVMFNGEIPEGLQVDHINGDTLDDRIENLRLVTQQENNFNETRAKGYSWHKTSNKWRAQLTLNDKQKHLGLFNTKEEAREAYLKAKEKYHIIKRRK